MKSNEDILIAKLIGKVAAYRRLAELFCNELMDPNERTVKLSDLKHTAEKEVKSTRSMREDYEHDILAAEAGLEAIDEFWSRFNTTDRSIK